MGEVEAAVEAPVAVGVAPEEEEGVAGAEAQEGAPAEERAGVVVERRAAPTCMPTREVRWRRKAPICDALIHRFINGRMRSGAYRADRPSVTSSTAKSRAPVLSRGRGQRPPS